MQATLVPFEECTVLHASVSVTLPRIILWNYSRAYIHIALYVAHTLDTLCVSNRSRSRGGDSNYNNRVYHRTHNPIFRHGQAYRV